MKYIFFYILLFTFSFLHSPSAYAAVLYFSPEESTVYELNTVVSEVWLDTEGALINAADITIFFPVNVLEVVQLNVGGSLFTLYPQEPFFSNEEGTIALRAGAPQGFEGKGVAAKIFFKAKEKGTATVRYSPTSKVFLNDGLGTPARLDVKEALFVVEDKPENLPVIRSPSHVDQTRWYRESQITMTWDVKEGTSYRYVLTRNPDELPDQVPGESVGKTELSVKEDGIFYFLLRECINGICGSPASYRILNDMTPPEPFEVLLGQEADAFEGKKFLSFVAVDQTSGIDHYEIRETDAKHKRETDAKWIKGESPYVLQDDFVAGTIQVKAVDNAGNERVASLVLRTSAVGYKNYAVFGIIIGMGLLGAYVYFRSRKQV